MNAQKIEKVKNSKPIRVVDILVIVAVVIFAFVAMGFLFGKQGKYVQIWHEGDLVQTLDINIDIDIDLEVRTGHMKIKIQNSQVWVDSVDCDDQVCKKFGHISHTNRQIVCTPNNVSIIIVDDNDDLIIQMP